MYVHKTAYVLYCVAIFINRRHLSTALTKILPVVHTHLAVECSSHSTYINCYHPQQINYKL
jgi:hypothetical protein